MLTTLPRLRIPKVRWPDNRRSSIVIEYSDRDMKMPVANPSIRTSSSNAGPGQRRVIEMPTFPLPVGARTTTFLMAPRLLAR